MTIEELNQQVKGLVELRAMKDEIKQLIDDKTATFAATMEAHYASLKVAQAEVAQANETVLNSLKKMEVDSFKNKTNTVSLKKRISYNITDEPMLIAGLYTKNLNREYVTETVRKEVWGIFDQVELPGVEKTETEYISVLNRKPTE